MEARFSMFGWFYVIVFEAFILVLLILFLLQLIPPLGEFTLRKAIEYSIPCGGALWLLWRCAQIPYRIKVIDDGTIHLVSYVGTTIIRTEEVSGLHIGMPHTDLSEFCLLVHQRGKILLLLSMDGIEDVLKAIRLANPGVTQSQLR